MTYKIATDLAQRRGRQLWLADLQGPAWEALPAEEQRANLVRSVKSLQSQITGLRANSPERKEIGLALCELNKRIHAIRPKSRLESQTVQHHFVDVARERLTPFLFSTFMGEASRRTRSNA